MHTDTESGKDIDRPTADLGRRVCAAIQRFQGEGRGHGAVIASEGASPVVKVVGGDAVGQGRTVVCTGRPRHFVSEGFRGSLKRGEAGDRGSKIDHTHGMRVRDFIPGCRASGWLSKDGVDATSLAEVQGKESVGGRQTKV